MGWDTVVTRAAADMDFKNKVLEAMENMAKAAPPPPKSFQPENFEQHNDMGYRYEQTFKLIPESEVMNGLSQKEVAKILQIDTFQDLAGQTVRGVLAKDGPARITLYRDHSTRHSSLLHQAEQQLRSQQGQDTAEWFRRQQQESNLLPAPMIPKASVKTEAEVWAALQVAKDQKYAAQEARHVFAEPVQQPEEAAIGGQESSSEHDEIEQEVQADSPALKMPGHVGAEGGKGKGKHKGPQKVRGQAKMSAAERKQAAKSKASPKRLRLTGKRSHADTASRSAMQSEVASSGASSAPGSAKTGKSAPTVSAVEKWHKDLNIHKLLTGRAVGVQAHHAVKALGGLRKSQKESKVADPTQNVQILLLQAHLDLFRRAEGLLPGNIKRVSKEERLAVLHELSIAQVEIPAHTAATLVGQACVEDEAASSKIARLTPGCDSTGFDAADPFLKCSGVPLPDQAKLIQRALVSETLLHSLCQGEVASPFVRELCMEMLKQWSPLQTTVGQQDAVMKVALSEVLQLATFLLALLGDDIADSGKIVSLVTSANKGVHLIVRQASLRHMILNNSHT